MTTKNEHAPATDATRPAEPVSKQPRVGIEDNDQQQDGTAPPREPAVSEKPVSRQ